MKSSNSLKMNSDFVTKMKCNIKTMLGTWTKKLLQINSLDRNFANTKLENFW